MMRSYVVKARDLAVKYHDGQRDKIGLDYFTSHVEVVANLTRSWGGSEYQVAAAYLHDLLEDTPITLKHLRMVEGFPYDVCTMVLALTKKDGESYPGFIQRVVEEPNAVLVKIADITSNMDPARLFYIEAETRNRLVKKYTDALPVLWEAYKGR